MTFEVQSYTSEWDQSEHPHRMGTQLLEFRGRWRFNWDLEASSIQVFP